MLALKDTFFYLIYHNPVNTFFKRVILKVNPIKLTYLFVYKSRFDRKFRTKGIVCLLEAYTLRLTLGKFPLEHCGGVFLFNKQANNADVICTACLICMRN